MILAGVPREDLLASFPAFLREGDAIATWGTYATRLMADARLAPGTPTFDLRRLAADWLRGSPGSIEGCVERLGLAAPVLGPGRGGRRLGLMLAMFQELQKPRRD